MGNPSPSQVPPHGTGKPRLRPPSPGLLFAQKLRAIKSPGLSDRGEVHVEAFGLMGTPPGLYPSYESEGDPARSSADARKIDSGAPSKPARLLCRQRGIANPEGLR
jgi:hypothetical protein